MPNATNIALIGCGQMGSRHLQALARLERSLRIQVVEPSPAARETGKMRLAEAISALEKKPEIEVQWPDQLSGLDGSPDLTIIATAAPERAQILDFLLKAGHKRFLIEKMVCQSARDYRRLLEAFSANKAKGWLNLTRRYFPFYRRLFGLLPAETPLVYHVMAGNLGLGCNAIHFLDLFAGFSGETKEIRLKGDHLSPRILQNRRGTDLVEFSGTILAETPKGDLASITFSPVHEAGVSATLTTKDLRVFIDEERHKAWIASAATDWIWEESPFQELYTSRLTTDIARSILEQDSCDLPTLEAAYPLHRELFRIFNRHIRRVTGRTCGVCPIT